MFCILITHSFFLRDLSLLWIEILIPCHLIASVFRRKSNLFSIKKSRPKIISYHCFPFGFTYNEVLSIFLLLVNCGKRKPIMCVVSPILKFPSLVSQMLVLSLYWNIYVSTNSSLISPPVLPVSRSPRYSVVFPFLSSSEIITLDLIFSVSFSFLMTGLLFRSRYVSYTSLSSSESES